MAAALLDGEVRIDTFRDERRFRGDMVELLGKIELEQDDLIPGDFHKMHVTVQVELEDGTRHTSVCRAPRGSWGVRMEPDEHEAKLRDCLRHASLEDAEAETLLAELDRLETLDGRAVAGLVTLMQPHAAIAAAISPA